LCQHRHVLAVVATYLVAPNLGTFSEPRNVPLDRSRYPG
jgi:hypothetical protein